MPDFAVDFSNVEDFEPLPVDLYEVEVKEVSLKNSQSKGEPMLAIQLEVLDGEYQGRKIFTNLMLAGAGMGITKQAFKALQIPSGEMNTEDMIGATATIRVTQRVYKIEDGGDGNVRNRVSTWISPEKLAGL